MASRRITVPYEIEYSMQRLIESEIDFNQVLQRLRQEISIRYDFNLADVYCMMQNKGPDHLLEEGSIATFVKKCGEKFSPEDENRVFRRFDLDRDGKIGYDDFSKMLLPSR